MLLFSVFACFQYLCDNSAVVCENQLEEEHMYWDEDETWAESYWGSTKRNT